MFFRMTSEADVMGTVTLIPATDTPLQFSVLNRTQSQKYATDYSTTGIIIVGDNLIHRRLKREERPLYLLRNVRESVWKND